MHDELIMWMIFALPSFSYDATWQVLAFDSVVDVGSPGPFSDPFLSAILLYDLTENFRGIAIILEWLRARDLLGAQPVAPRLFAV